MNVFKLPLTLCDDLMKQIKLYWWGSEKGKRKTQWVPWEKMIQLKGYGGLGFRDLRLFNQALLAHQVWRLVAFPDSLCARVLMAKYYPQENLLDTVVAYDASQTWGAIEHGLELMKKGIINRIGNGQATRIWRDNWLPRPMSLWPSGSCRPCRLRKVSHLIRQGSGSWHEAVVHRYFYPWDVDEILKMKLPSVDMSDSVAWHYEKFGLFSVKSAYRLALMIDHDLGSSGSSTAPDGGRMVWKNLWNLSIPPKIKVFLWRVTNNELATNATRNYRHMTPTSC
jgi:hypothetical protein